jgi:hypothetical protein
MKPGAEVFQLKISFDLERVQREVLGILEHTHFHSEAGQICLNHRPGAAAPYYDGVGSLWKIENGEHVRLAAETDFSQLHPDLRGTYIEEVIERTREFVGRPIGRVRLMRLQPKSCLSFHRDSEVRVHLPIFTNEQCFMVFRNGLFQIPADGSLYATNTIQQHTAFNGHATDARIHLVFSVESSDFDHLLT